jgi:hypothetical protein
MLSLNFSGWIQPEKLTMNKVEGLTGKMRKAHFFEIVIFLRSKKISGAKKYEYTCCWNAMGR